MILTHVCSTLVSPFARCFFRGGGTFFTFNLTQVTAVTREASVVRVF